MKIKTKFLHLAIGLVLAGCGPNAEQTYQNPTNGLTASDQMPTRQLQNGNGDGPGQGQGSGAGQYQIDPSDFVNGKNLITNIEKSDLTQAEKNGLLKMREEEKLAHDLYLALGKKWGLNIFSNIAESEQTHTNTIKILIDRYELTDPAKDKAAGEYASNEIKALYLDLTKKGEASLNEALIVGATIEDLDIKDLDDLMNQTDNQDIILAYKNLQKGSRNHLRAFIRQIEKNGDSYSPAYISQADFDAIINSDQEKGMAQ